jgi:hypothetical protein
MMVLNLLQLLLLNVLLLFLLNVLHLLRLLFVAPACMRACIISVLLAHIPVGK